MLKISFLPVCISGTFWLGAVAWAQTPVEQVVTTETTVSPQTDVEAAVGDLLLGASRLPLAANRVRAMGVREDDLVEALRGLHEHQVSAAEAEQVLDETADAAGRHGPVDNFGAFVNEQLEQGLRGRDLAEAIHREHAARGRGPRGRAVPRGPGDRTGDGLRTGPERGGGDRVRVPSRFGGEDRNWGRGPHTGHGEGSGRYHDRIDVHRLPVPHPRIRIREGSGRRFEQEEEFTPR